PPLLPADPLARARVRAFALVLAADTHPLQNLRVLNALRDLGLGEAVVGRWAAEVNATGLAACEALLEGIEGPFCFGARPTLADICLVPQLGNARRFGVDLAAYPRLLAREAACLALPAFVQAAPDRQPDAE
ncbi:MAG: glutathione S-transferase C-terminal domain-containing protein, partial [Geminicoccaceae bacterium]|nr:glutathione S-transferase C-terminal domain-containing protein [Geminicoccaceae bacterium]